MATSSTDDLVAQFQEITNVDRSFAISYLGKRGNNLETAINAFFGGEDVFKDTPELSLNSNERPSYDIEAPDFSGNSPKQQLPLARKELGLQTSNVAPSRPPSRNRNARSDSLMGDQLPEGEEGAFVIEREGESSMQEGGVFGPATRPYYDASEWALTSRSTTDPGYDLDVDLTQRQRFGDEPVFFKPLPNGDHLPSLITILGNNPVCRKWFLTMHNTRQSPEYDPGWWDGSSEFAPSSRRGAGDITELSARELLEETSKLVAFMMRTERSYGSVATLSELPALEDLSAIIPNKSTLVEKFLVAWGSAAAVLTGNDDCSKVFRNVRKQSSNPEDVNAFWCITDDLRECAERVRLYDILDRALWPSDVETAEELSYISEAADTFVLRLIQPAVKPSKYCLDVPFEWSRERYLQSNLDEVFRMRNETEQLRKHVESLRERRNRLRTFRYEKTNSWVGALELLKTAIGILDNIEPCEGVSVAMLELLPRAISPEQACKSSADIVSQLRLLHDRIENESRGLEEHMQGLQQALESQSSGNEDQEKAGENGDGLIYRLCGVSIRPGITFTPYLDGQQLYERDENASSLRWWRLEFTSDSRVSKRRSDVTELLQAIQDSDGDIFIVYVNQKAVVSTPCTPLPAVLEDFIRADNAAFSEEISAKGMNANSHFSQPAEWHPEIPAVDEWPAGSDGTVSEDTEWDRAMGHGKQDYPRTVIE